MRRQIILSIAISVLLALLVVLTPGRAQAASTVRVSGNVPTACPGPIQVNHSSCNDTLVFTRGHHHVTVHGHFSIKLAPGRYQLTIDHYCDPTVTITRATTLPLRHLLDGCLMPL